MTSVNHKEKNKMSDLHEVVKNEDWQGLLVNVLLRYIADGWTEDEVDEIIVLEENADEEFTFVMGDAEYIEDQMPNCFTDSIVSHRQNNPDDEVVLCIIKHNKDETTDFGCISIKKETFKISIRKLQSQ